MLAIGLINFRGISESVTVNMFLSVIELSGLLLIILIGAVALAGGTGDPGRAFAFKEGANVPLSILAHSTHVKGAGSYDAQHGERPRIQVTLATGIPEPRCRRINLGFADVRDIDPAEWEGREEEGILVVRNAGEVLYRS